MAKAERVSGDAIGEAEKVERKPRATRAENLRIMRANPEKMDTNDVLRYGTKIVNEYANTLIAKAREKGDVNDLSMRIMKVRTYFLSAENSHKESPLGQMAKLYENLEWPADGAEKGEYKDALCAHFKILVERAFDQHFENPEQYVSHGFDHSLNVASYAENIVIKFPAIISNVMSSYGISEGEAKFLIQNAALFHDCGYCSLAEEATKTVHSIASTGILTQPDYRKSMRTLVRNANPEQKDLMLYDLEGAVLFHNADKVERAFTSRVISTRGEYIALANEDSIIRVVSSYSQLGYGEERSMAEIVIEVKNSEMAEKIKLLLAEAMTSRGLDSQQMPQIRLENAVDSEAYYGRAIDFEPGDKAIGLEYKTADTLEDSLLSVLRVADNMDMLPERFSETQQMPAFKDICKFLGDQISPESKCLKILERSADVNIVSEAIKDFLNEIPIDKDLTTKEQENLDKIKEYAKNLGTRPKFTEDREELASLIKQFSIYKVLKQYNLSSEESESLLRIASLQSSESFRHFGGCDSLLSIQIDAGVTPDQAIIRITVEKDLFSYLQQFSVEEKTQDKKGKIVPVAVPIGEYQIWRLTEALQANKHGKKAITVKVFDDEGNELTNLFSLKEKL